MSEPAAPLRGSSDAGDDLDELAELRIEVQELRETLGEKDREITDLRADLADALRSPEER